MRMSPVTGRPEYSSGSFAGTRTFQPDPARDAMSPALPVRSMFADACSMTGPASRKNMAEAIAASLRPLFCLLPDPRIAETLTRRSSERCGSSNSLDRHNRDCEKVAKRLGIKHVVLPLELRGTPFEAIEVVDNRIWKERALWWKKTKTLVVAEAVGASKMFNPSGAGVGVHIGLRATPPRKQLGTYNPEHLLMGHGDPVNGDQATLALQEALDRSRRDLPGTMLKIPFAFR